MGVVEIYIPKYLGLESMLRFSRSDVKQAVCKMNRIT